MSLMSAPANTAVWVDENRCKACDKCVSVCPAGTLAMQYNTSSTLGAMVKVVSPDSCIGCNECELTCPDFAIFVADRKELKEAGVSFAKLTDEAKARQEKIVANKYMSLSQGA